MKRYEKRSASLSTDGVLTIALYGEIGPSWAGMIDAQWVRYQLLSAGNVKRVELLINSAGGDVFEGITIYNELRNFGARVTVKIMGLAASVASLIAMAGDKRIMMRASRIFIHETEAIIYGNAGELEKEAVALRQTNEECADIYASHGGGDRAKFLELMTAETWLNGEQAKALGLVDVIETTGTPQAGDAGQDQAMFIPVPYPLDAGALRGRAIPDEARELFDPASLEARDAAAQEGGRELRRRERREVYAYEGAELRADMERRVIAGTIPYNQETEIRKGQWEVIRRGAFDGALKGDGEDVFAFWNHNPDVVLGSRDNGTLKLWDDERGLHFEVTPPDSPEGNSKLESVSRGDVKGVSFAFNAKAEGGATLGKRAAGGSLRELRVLKVYEFSPGVPHQAYRGATAGARSADGAADEAQGETSLVTEPAPGGHRSPAARRLLLAAAAKQRGGTRQ